MGSAIRFPTLLGLGILITGITLGMALLTRNQTLKTQASRSLTPKNITTANVTDNSVSIYWQTDEPTTGFIKAGPSNVPDQTFRDDRDLQVPQIHSLHFVTLNKLQPNTTYYYKISSGVFTYPKDKTLSFKTIAPINPSISQPLIGTILNPALSPTEEALITLQIPGAQNLAAVTKVSGNFMLPLTEIRTENLTGSFNLEASVSAKLIATNFEKSAQVDLSLPYQDTTLPPIILGKDMVAVPQTTTIPVPATQPTPQNLSRFDLNDDGVINSLDQSIILNNMVKISKGQRSSPANKQTDLNDDGIIDQKDLDLISQFINHQILK